MRIATVLTPPDDRSLRWAAQCGVTDLTLRYPGPNTQELLDEIERVSAYGFKVSAIEGHLPIEQLKLGQPGRKAELDELRRLFEVMKQAQIPILCYNFMAGTDWVRTQVDAPERGGARVTRFDIDRAEAAVSLQYEAGPLAYYEIGAGQLWENLHYLLENLVPDAAAAGVYLCMHPDDPPLPSFMGRARIMNSVAGFEKLLSLSDDPHNAVCFCQGTFAEMGVDVPSAIRRLGSRIRFVHFRDVRGTAEHFAETFHDNGQTNMAEAIRAYIEVGYDGPMRPDHVPQLDGEEGEPGYTMLGRLFAYGYMRGLIQAVQNEMRRGG